MAGKLGNEVRKGNAKRHIERNKPWNKECAEIDVDELREQLSIRYIRIKQLTYEERQELKRQISVIQRAKEKRERYMFRNYFAA